MSESNILGKSLHVKEKIKFDNGPGTGTSISAPSVMVVDDDPMILKLLIRFLTVMKIDVQGFVDPCEALEVFTKCPVAVVLTDLDMPGMDGIELLKKMKAICPYSKIIIITGYGDEMQEEKAFRAGATQFMEKPVQMQKLRTLVASLLDESPNEG